MRKGDAEGNLAEHQRYSSVSATSVVDTPASLLDRAANGLPESAGITTRDFLCFFLFCLISLPAIWFPIHQMCVLLTVNCRVADSLLEKPTLVYAESNCSPHCGHHVLRVVHCQSPWNRTRCEATRSAPRFRSGVGNGL